jgi:hypothetical protein
MDSIPSSNALRPVTLDTLAAIYACNHGLAAYCAGCRRWVEFDLARLIQQGHGDRRLLIFRPRCRVCHSRGALQLRPPMPTWIGYRPFGDLER